jgi:hypothetical protein
MNTNNSKGTIVAPIPNEVENREHTGGDLARAPNGQSAPKTVTDHKRGSTGKPVPASAPDQEPDTKRRGKST